MPYLHSIRLHQLNDNGVIHSQIRKHTKFTSLLVMLACYHSLSSPNDDGFYLPRSSKGKDSHHIAVILKTFNFETSDAWRALTQQFSTGVRHKELCSVALILSHCFGIQSIPRDARRSYPVLIKWFQDNWNEIRPVLPLIALRDDDNRVINFERESFEHSEKWK
jgi:hypothetical protein